MPPTTTAEAGMAVLPQDGAIIGAVPCNAIHDPAQDCDSTAAMPGPHCTSAMANGEGLSDVTEVLEPKWLREVLLKVC